MKNHIRILVIDAYTDGNIGSGALVENSINLLRQNFPDAEIEILAQFPKHIAEFTGIRTSPELFIIPFNQPRLKQIIWFASSIVWMSINMIFRCLSRFGLKVPPSFYTLDKKKRLTIDRIGWADMIVSVGAERINDNFFKTMPFSLYTLWVMKSHGKFLVLFPQTIGPFHFRFSRCLSTKILDKCDVIFLRDERSQQEVDSLGVKRAHVIRTCDVAILQNAIHRDEANGVLRDFGVPTDNSKLFGISAMHWSYIKAKGKSRYDDYKRAIARVADDMVREHKTFIVFVATNMSVHGCREDDLLAAKDILSIMEMKRNACIVSRLCSPSEMKGIMGVFELFLATRMHACIFSTGICTPTVSINYQFKLKEYMRSMGLERYSLDIDQVQPDNLREVVRTAWDNRGEIRNVLSLKTSQWKSQLHKTMEEFAQKFSKQDSGGQLR